MCMSWCNQSVHATFLAFCHVAIISSNHNPNPGHRVLVAGESKVGYQFVAVNDCCRSRLENLEECLVGVLLGKPRHGNQKRRPFGRIPIRQGN